jgi:hypothetical protein
MSKPFELFIPEKEKISQLAICIEILKLYNCRANEVLKAKWQNFIPQKMLVLESSKQSCNVIVRDRFILHLIENLPHLDTVLIFPSVNYNKLYHHCKIYYSHLFIKFKKRRNLKVTHGFRYLNVSQFGTEEIIRDILHHRTIKSGKYYKPQIKR